MRLNVSEKANRYAIERIGGLDNNVGMQKLALKAGFLEEGRRKEALYREGIYHDIIEYGIINEVL